MSMWRSNIAGNAAVGTIARRHSRSSSAFHSRYIGSSRRVIAQIRSRSGRTAAMKSRSVNLRWKNSSPSVPQ